MDIFGFGGLGTWEIALILLVFMIFVGPARMPEVVRGLGKAYRKVKEATNELSRDIKEMENDIKDVAKGADGVTNRSTGASGDIDGIKRDLDGVGRELRDTLKSAIEDKGGKADKPGG